MCGKDMLMVLMTMKNLGSPPHVRERLDGIHYLPTHVGITPACAGKTDLDAHHIGAHRDHPRMCGKDLKCAGFRREAQGSPPHVRERLC